VTPSPDHKVTIVLRIYDDRGELARTIDLGKADEVVNYFTVTNSPFSPDSDGVDDMLILEFNGQQATWDGTDVDGNLLPNGNYYVTIESIELGSERVIVSHQVVLMAGAPRGIENIVLAPNPARDSVLISYSYANARSVRIKVYNLAAELVRILHDDDLDGQVRWDLELSSGSRASSGVYIVMIEGKAPNGETVRAITRLMVL